jgi:hypothetical protein
LCGSKGLPVTEKPPQRGKLKGLNIAGKPEFVLGRRASKKNGPYGPSGKCVSGG